jgi:hypothetical protein
MRKLSRSIMGASLLALTVGLPAGMAQAQAPASGTAPSVAPRTTNPPASTRRYASNNPQRRVYTVPSQGTPSTRRRLHYGYFPARREVPLYKPWLRPD